MASEVQSMKDRRLDNLDSSIVYYGKRLSKHKRQLVKARANLDSDPKSFVFALAVHILEALVKELEDVISYLKLC